MGREKRKNITKRFCALLLCFFLVLAVNFFLPRLMPGDPVLMLTGIESESISEGQYEMYYEKLGLGNPLIVQFKDYLISIFDGTLGYSYHHESTVWELISKRLANTLSIALPVFLISSTAAFLLGTKSGSRKDGIFDKSVTGANIIFSAFPSFLIGIIFLYVFAFVLNIFPLSGTSSLGGGGFFDKAWHLTLPIIVLTLSAIPAKYILVRNLVATEMTKDYVIYNEIRGISRFRLLFVHIGRNIILPYISSLSISFGFILTGSMIVENIFSIKGMGALMYSGVLSRDFPTLQGCLFVTTIAVLLAQLLAEILSLALLVNEKGGETNE